MFEDTYDNTLALATTIFALLSSLGLKVHPTKGHFLPILLWDHIGMILDFDKGEFRAPNVKLKDIRSSSEGDFLQSSLPQAPGERKSSCLPSEQDTILAIGHSRGQVLPREAARRREVREELAGYRQGGLSFEARKGEKKGKKTYKRVMWRTLVHCGYAVLQGAWVRRENVRGERV